MSTSWSTSSSKSFSQSVRGCVHAGLGGELRNVPYIERRIMEAAKLGYSTIIIPTASRLSTRNRFGSIAVLPCRNVCEAIDQGLGRDAAASAQAPTLRKAATGAASASGPVRQLPVAAMTASATNASTTPVPARPTLRPAAASSLAVSTGELSISLGYHQDKLVLAALRCY